VAFEIAAGEVAATVVHVADVDDHLGSGGFCGGVDGVGVMDYDVGAMGFAEADFVGLDHELAGFAAVVDGADHDHAAAKGKLSVLDGFVVRAEVDGLLFESEGGDKPFDSRERVAVTEARDDSGVGGVDLSVHSWKDVTADAGGLGKIGGAEEISVEWDVVGPDAAGGGVVGGAEAGEGAEVVGEVRLVVVAAGEGEIGPADVGTCMHELEGLLEALNAAVEFWGDAD
jgi:hypothetical protein